MRFRRLALHAYGSLTDVSFDFDGPSRLEIVFGRNEAGKSTTLRAISAFLYGYTRATKDAYLHRFSALRIGATLESENGHTEQFERRTEHSKSVVFQDDGSRVDDETLVRIAGGVDKASFEKMYGLNHETLRKGAEALLTNSEAGENLFGAALGGSALRQTLEDLEKRAKELYSDSANSKNALISRLKKEYDEALRNVQIATSLESAYTENVRALDEKRKELENAQAELETVNRGRDRIVASLAILAPLRQRRQLLDRERELGSVVVLPSNAAQLRADAERALRTTTAAFERTRREIHAAEEKLKALHTSDALLSRRADLDSLAAQLHAFRAHAVEMPTLRADLDLLEAEEKLLLRNVGDTHWEPFSRGSLESERILSLLDLTSDEPARISEKQRALRNETDTLQTAEAELAKLEASGHAEMEGSLRIALERARSVGDLDAEFSLRQNERRKEEEALLSLIANLGLPTPTVAAFCELRPPSIERMEEFEQQWRHAEDDIRSAEAVLERVDTERKSVSEERARLEAEGDIPSEEDLLRARGERDSAWATLRKKERPTDDLLDAFEAKVRETDTLSDRLRREASRVSRRAHLASKLQAVGSDKVAAEGLVRAAGERFASLKEAWRTAWEHSGMAPLLPEYMVKWARRFHEAHARRERLSLATERLTALERERHEQTTAIAALLGPNERTDPSETFGSARERLKRAWESAADQARKKIELANRVERAKGVARTLEREIDDLVRGAEAAKRTWDETTRLLGRGPVSARDARALLAACHELHEKKSASAKLRGALDKSVRASEAFLTLGRQLSAELAPDLSALSPELSATQLLERYRNAERESNLRAHIEGTLKNERTTLQRLEHEQREHSLVLEGLMRHAGVTILEELAEAESRSETVLGLRQERATLEAVFADYASDIDSWEAELKGSDRAGLVRKQEEFDYARSDLDDKIQSLNADIEGLQRGLDKTQSSAEAAQAAAIAEDKLTRLRNAVEEYAVTKLAIEVLRAEIDKYADAHQGPILSKTSTLFARFTLGAYSSVRVVEENLHCVRPDGADVPVEKLSDGTRDQLYLALRLASLERQRESGAALPLVLDDILVHSDDERARAVLSSLAELARSTQVLFFTHHARIVELASEALAPTLFRVHDLSPKSDLDTKKAQLLLS